MSRTVTSVGARAEDYDLNFTILLFKNLLGFQSSKDVRKPYLHRSVYVRVTVTVGFPESSCMLVYHPLGSWVIQY